MRCMLCVCIRLHEQNTQVQLKHQQHWCWVCDVYTDLVSPLDCPDKRLPVADVGWW